MRHKPKNISRWLIVGWLLIGLVGAFEDRNPRRVYRAEPISTTAILISLAVGAATTAAEVGLQYLMAKRQKVAPIDRGKQDDIRISIPGYGEPIIWARGTVRSAPVWIWHTPIVHTTVTTPGHSGGKGAPKPPTPATVDHIYSTSVAGLFHDGEIKSVRRIWFGNDLVWNTTPDLSAAKYEAEDAALAGGAHALSSSIASAGQKVTAIGNGGTVMFSVVIDSTGSYDLAVFYLDSTTDLSYEVRVDGVSQGFVTCPASGTNLMAIQTIGLTLSAGTRSIQFRNTGAACPDMDRIEVVKTVAFTGGSTADNRQFTGLIDPSVRPATDQTKAWPFYNALPIEDDGGGSGGGGGGGGGSLPGTSTLTANLAKWGQPQIRIYRGTVDQPADPAIIAAEGVDNVPAWRGYAYIVIEAIQLPNGSLPNVTIEFDQGTTAVDQIVKDVYALGNVADSNLAVSALSGLTIPGVIRTSRLPLDDTIRDLRTRFQFDMVEFDGLSNAVMKNRTDVDLVIPFAKLRARLNGSDAPAQDAIITDMDPLLFPWRYNVNYLNAARDYHNDTQYDTRAFGPQVDEQSISVSLVDDEQNMKRLASTLLYQPDLEGRQFEIVTGPEYNRAVPGTVIKIQLPNSEHTFRVTDAKYSLPAGPCSFTGVRQAPSIYSPTGFGSLGNGVEPPIVPFPGNTKGIIIDGPLLRAEDAGDGTQAVVYIAMCGTGGGTWTGGFMYGETPLNSGNFDDLLTIADKSSGIGITHNALPSVSDPTAWDRSSTLTISLLYDPGLSSASEADLAANPNLNLLAVINPSTHGVEYIQFKTVTPLTPLSPFVAKYSLSTVLRGRFTTEDYVGVHTSADDVVVIDSTIRPRRISPLAIGV